MKFSQAKLENVSKTLKFPNKFNFCCEFILNFIDIKKIMENFGNFPGLSPRSHQGLWRFTTAGAPSPLQPRARAPFAPLPLDSPRTKFLEPPVILPYMLPGGKVYALL